MNIDITSELLQTIYKRAQQYAVTKWGKEPDYIEISEDRDGIIIAKWVDYHCGDRDDNSEYISAENLTEDLDSVAEQRKKELERQRAEYEKKQREANQRHEEQQKERRKQEYIKLKKEFEP